MKPKYINFFSPIILITLFWAIVFPIRFFTLGFYHDDWTLVGTEFSETGINFLMNLFGNRPLLGVAHIIGLILNCQNESFNAQLFGALQILITAWILYLFYYQSIFFIFGTRQQIICILCVFVWLVMPWSLGTFCWYITTPTIMATLGFSFSGLMLIRYWMCVQKAIFLVPFGVLVSCLSYEIFILQFPILICLLFLSNKPVHDFKTKFNYSVIAILLPIFLSFVIRKFGESFGGSPSKSFYPDFLKLVLQDLTFKWMADSLGGTPYMVLKLLICLLIIVFLVSLIQKYQLDLYKRVFGLALVILVGFFVSCLTPSLASYALVGTGIFSRTNLGVSFWLSFFVVALSSVSSLKKNKAIFILNHAVIIGIVLLFWHITNQNLKPWQQVWTHQSDLLRSAAKIDFSKMPTDSLVVLDSHVQKNGVCGFGAPWDLNAAMHHLYPSSKHVRFIVANSYWKVESDGKQVKQHHDNNILFQMETANAYQWNKKRNEINPLVVGDVIGED